MKALHAANKAKDVPDARFFLQILQHEADTKKPLKDLSKLNLSSDTKNLVESIMKYTLVSDSVAKSTDGASPQDSSAADDAS